MRTTIIPAQITTVEDRIAGNFTFSQIVLLIIALLTSFATYAIVPERMHVGPIKLFLIGLQIIIFGGLALRFRGKILADWLIIYLRFKSRPRTYIFTKNDLTARDIQIAEHNNETPIKQVTNKQKVAKNRSILSLGEQTKINRLIEDVSLTISFKPSKKGGVDVELKPIK